MTQKPAQAEPIDLWSEPALTADFAVSTRYSGVSMPAKATILAGLLLITLLVCGASGAEVPNAGPLFDRFGLTLEPGERFEAAGPFFYSESKEGENLWAIPPLLSHQTRPQTDSEEWEFAYPVLTYERFGTQYRWQFCQVLSFSGGETQLSTNRHRFSLFPVYFQQRSSDTNENYTAVFPFYGHLKNRFLRDETTFIMFPAYSETRKGDIVTDNYLYPFFHRRHGNGLTGWQAWPFVGHEHKEITTRTNGFNDVQIIGGHDDRFILWPMYFKTLSGIGTENPVSQQGILPFYSLERSPKRDGTTVLWPFFSKVDDREKKYREWDAPWPFVVFAHGEGKTTTRIWPFYSQAHTPTLESDFYLWPIYKFNSVHADPLDRRRTRILFFLYSDLVQKSTETGATLRRKDCWPLFAYRREYNGNTRLQVMAILEPFLPGSHKIERDYSPLYAFWRSEHNPTSGAASQSLLWNLYRRETTPNSKKCSLLFGLFQYQSDSAGKRTRIFYIPLGKTKSTSQPKAAAEH